ncbi:MAG: DUF1292 domain-containing protein [Lachnospiraceae bacterium]|nr:DUF1292 domain-containing protein [Lachnospiraceae bacterium]
MAKQKADFIEMDDDILVSLEMDDGTTVICAIISVLPVLEKDYIALLPLPEDGELDEDSEIWFYRCLLDEKQEAEPIIEYIESDDEYDQVADAFEEFLESLDFEELRAMEEERNKGLS